MRALIRFGKQPRLRFISHLDLQRFFQRAVNRTGLPIAYTQGFNPHPVMSFGSALALGWTSEYEVIDIKLSAPMGRKRTEDAVRAALPEDLPVLEVRMVDDRHPAPMAQVCQAEYKIELTGESASAVIDSIGAFMERETVAAVKKTKSGEKEINARPLVIDLKPESNGLTARLMLTERDSIKPDLLIALLSDMAGVEPPEARIHRTLLLGEDAEGRLRPLMEL
ncbi:MAG: TIGR03936 family radical SAM-associated protein [Clostridia bacterium]|nr:TIGR03936 family radical SAM-associated protein [Clostridia bacterium]